MPAISLDLGDDDTAFGRSVGLDYLPALHTTADWSLHTLAHGMASGATSLMLAIPVIVDGVEAVVIAETSLQAWTMAATALRAAHTDELDQVGWAVLSDDARAAILPRYQEAIRRVLAQRGDPLPDTEVVELAELLLDALSAGTPE